MNRVFCRMAMDESSALVLAGVLVLGASIAGNAESGRLWLSLGLIAAAVLVAGMSLLTARAPSPAGLAPPASGSYRGSWMVGALTALLLLHCGLAWCFVRSTPLWIDDCFVFQRDAVNDLLHGVDPYGRTRPDIYDARYTAAFYTPETVINGRVQVGLQYPPVTFLCALPGVLMGNLRYGYIAAIALSSIFLFAALPDARGLTLAVILLLNPMTFLVEGMSWTEPLVWLLLCATFYTALKRPRWLPLALGLFLVSKQYNVLALPYLGYCMGTFSWRGYGRLVCRALAVGLATLLPFAVWNARALWHDLVWFHLAQPFRGDAVSFAVIFPLALKFGPFIVLAFIACALRYTPRRAELFPALYAMTLLLFVVVSKQAFMNYFFLIAQCLLLSGVALGSVHATGVDGIGCSQPDGR